MSVREAVRLKEQGIDTVTTELVDLKNIHNVGRVTFSKDEAGNGYVNMRVANKYGIAIELHRIEAEKLISVLMSMQL